MPIKAENKALYPLNWKTISLEVRQRANMRCEFCGVENYAVGYRDSSGAFHRLGGSGPCDAAGEGKRWPSLEPITFSEAREFAEAANTESNGRDAEGNRWFVIVLTCAHLNHDPTDNRLENLKSLCQMDHLAMDAAHHR